DETVRLRLLAKSLRDQSVWFWNGHEWQRDLERRASARHVDGNQLAERMLGAPGKPEILDDPRLEPATQWLRRLDWFTPEAGLWIGDANENFLDSLAGAW